MSYVGRYIAVSIMATLFCVGTEAALEAMFVSPVLPVSSSSFPSCGENVIAGKTTSSSCSRIVRNKNSCSGNDQAMCRSKSPLPLYMVSPRLPNREDEIRRKILKLKKEGKLGKNDKATGNNPDATNNDDASSNQGVSEDSTKYTLLKKVRQSREGDGKRSMITRQYEESIKRKLSSSRKYEGQEKGEQNDNKPVSAEVAQESDVGNENTDDDDTPDDEEKSLVDLVAKTLQEKAFREAAEGEEKRMQETNMAKEAELKEKEMEAQLQSKPAVDSSPEQIKKTTSGIGGAWKAPDEKSNAENYKPSRGSWGAFPRPKNISTAYGGGKRVGAGVMSEAEERLRMEKSSESTKDRLQAYRQKVGIDVQSEKDHMEEIEEALALSGRAMQRGVYDTAVSILEKVTSYCSSNSKVGGKVFLELAMAYEAAGRTTEAISVFTTLTTSRNEEVKFDAKRLLYGIEAINFMRNEARDKSFSKQKSSQDFIDATGFANIVDNFDDVYNTAYVDMDSGSRLFKRLTESVVRTSREARLILLQATNSGEVDRLRIVQALRTINRDFIEAISEEKQARAREKLEKSRPVVMIDGKPIERPKEETEIKDGRDAFSPEQMIENLNGEWRLQLVADKKGDGVRFFNTTTAWQIIDTSAMKFESSTPAGFMTMKESGKLTFEKPTRTLKREEQKKSGAWLGDALGVNAGVTASCQQIISADSVLCIMRLADEKALNDDNAKDYFSVWRRVEKGTFSGK